MSALTGILRRVERTTGSTKRLRVIILLAALLAIGSALMLYQRAPDAVLYSGERVLMISPAESEVCIGGTVHFATVTKATEDQIPGRLEIDEAWCLAGPGGACKTVQPPNPRFPLLEPKNIVTPRVSRVVPDNLAPGVYHFWHAATDNKGNVTGYIVAPITIKDCSE